MKLTNEQFQRKNVFIVVAILALPVTKAQSAPVSVTLRNTLPFEFTQGKYKQGFEGYASESFDLAVPLESSYSGTTRSSASADLESGSLHAYASAKSSVRASAYAQADFQDVLIFTPDPGTTWVGNDWVLATITMTVHAVKSEFTGVINRLGGNGNFAQLKYRGGGRDDADFISFFDINGLTSVSRTLVLRDIKVFHPLATEDQEIHLSGAIAASAEVSDSIQELVDGEFFCQFDASHTALISIDVPEGISFTSESGHFLTKPIQETAPLKITAFAAQEDGSWQVTLKGESSSNYKLTGSPDIDFPSSTDISYTTVVTGSVVDVATFATDANGDAVVNFPLAGTRNFIRVETP